ncbi:MAG: ferritin-like domain-containing protein, partial [Ginsengibacter sp.]
MKTSQTWIEHFRSNSKIHRIDWGLAHSLTNVEKGNILASMKAWQLGETSDGAHLIQASRKYAAKINDEYYL